MITLRIEGDEALTATLAALGADAPRAAGAALYQEAGLIMARSKEYVPVDVGDLRSGGHVQLPVVTPLGASVRMGYGGTAGRYAVFVHEGTGPAIGRPAFMPPSSAFVGWVRRNIGGSDKDVKRIAFLVARSVGRHGLKPTKFLERAVNEARPGASARIGKHLNAWLVARAAKR